MRLHLPVLFVATAVGCVQPVALRYDSLQSLSPSADPAEGTLVVTEPYDDRYAGEKAGETMTARWTFAFVGFGYGTYRGNYVTGDERFAAYPGPFGNRSVAPSVGNVLVAALGRAGVATEVRADPDASVVWRCQQGTCIPDTDDMIEVARRHGARYVIAPRLAHLFGTQFGERTAWAANYEQVQGNYVYQVTEAGNEETFSGAAGSAVLELTVFEFKGGTIARVVRRSVVGTAYSNAPARMSSEETTAEVAVAAMRSLFDDTVATIIEVVAAR